MKRFAVFAAIVLAAAPARADQTDPALDKLFLELRAGTPLEAEAVEAGIVEIWSDAASDTVDVLYARAEEAAAHDEGALALALLDHVTGLAPHFAQGFALRARVRQSLGDIDGALEDYDTALDLEPRHFLVRHQLGRMLEDSRDDRAAFDMYQSALEWNPHHAPSRRRADILRRRIEGQEI